MSDQPEMAVRGDFNRVVGHGSHDNVLGDVHHHHAMPGARLAGFPRRTDPPRDVAARPALLLSARFESAPFAGRSEQLRRLDAWRRGSAPAAVTLLHGRGGQGKTRLAIEFARRGTADGWQTLEAFAPQAGEPDAGTGIELDGVLDAGRDTLVVVDYADRWPTADLRVLISRVTSGRGGRMRVLLIGRTADDWWTAVRQQLYHTAVGTSALLLQPLVDDGLSRDGVFREALRAFRRRLGGEQAAEPGGLPPAWHGEPPRDVLSIHMAALFAAVANDPEPGGFAPSRGAQEVAGYLLEREFEHVRRLVESRRVSSDAQVLKQAIYIISLMGRQPYQTARGALRECGIGASDSERDRILAEFRTLYPDEHDGHPALPFPDRLIEDMCGLMVPVPGGRREAGTLAEAWAEDLPARLIGATPELTGPVLGTLIAAGERWRHVYDAQILPILDAVPERTVQLSPAAFRALADSHRIGGELLHRLVAIVSKGRPAGFERGFAALIGYLINEISRASERGGQLEVLAYLHGMLADVLLAAGDQENAREARQQEILLRSRIDPTPRHRAKLADAVLAISDLVANFGCLRIALRAANDAVTVLEAIAGQDAQYRLRLAQALYIAGLRMLGLRGGEAADDPAEQAWTDEALATLRRAEAIYRSLEGEYPAEAGGTLGGILAHIGLVMAETDPWGAEPVGAEAVALLARVVAADPLSHQRTVLAMALIGHSVQLTETGRPDQASCELDEAARIWQEVSGSRQAKSIDHARSLRDIGRYQYRIGRRFDGLANSIRGATWFVRDGNGSRRVPVNHEAVCEMTRLYEGLDGDPDVEAFLDTTLSCDEAAVARISRSMHWHRETVTPREELRWAAAAVQAGAESDAIVGWTHVYARFAWQKFGDDAEREALWRETTGEGAPEWIRLDPIQSVVIAWIETPDPQAQYEILRSDPNLLNSVALLREALLLIVGSGDGDRAERMAERWRSVQLYGLEATYEPLILRSVMNELAMAEPEQKRRVYTRDAELLQKETAHALLEELAESSDRDGSSRYVETHALVDLLKLYPDTDAIFDALGDTARFPSLFAAVGDHSLAALHAATMLVFTNQDRVADAGLRAEALLYWAAERVGDGGLEPAEGWLREAIALRPGRSAAWREILGNLADSHPGHASELRALRASLSQMSQAGQLGRTYGALPELSGTEVRHGSGGQPDGSAHGACGCSFAVGGPSAGAGIRR